MIVMVVPQIALIALDSPHTISGTFSSQGPESSAYKIDKENKPYVALGVSPPSPENILLTENPGWPRNRSKIYGHASEMGR